MSLSQPMTQFCVRIQCGQAVNDNRDVRNGLSCVRGWLEVNAPFIDPFVTHLEAVQNCHRKNIICSYPFPPFWTSQLLLLQFKFTAAGLLGYRISCKCLIIEITGLDFYYG